MITDNYCKKEPNKYFCIKSVRMKNFRCFSHLNVEFNMIKRKLRNNNTDIEVAPLTVLVAPNGMGKSTVLDAVRIAFGTFTSAFDYPSTVHISKLDIRIVTDGETNQSSFSLPVEIEATGELNDQTCAWRRALTRESGRTTTREARCIFQLSQKLKQKIKGKHENSAILPLIAYYGTSRLWKIPRNTEKEKPLIKPRDFGYKDCLCNDSNYQAAHDWIKDALWAELTAKQYPFVKDTVLQRQLQAFRIALGDVFEKVEYFHYLHFNSYFKELAITKLDENDRNESNLTSLPISALSDGVRAIFAMVSDIAFRCVKLNPDLGENACQNTPGIVLIDEIDQHLHPAWQQKILDSLQVAFPKLQLIVTTHSPQVISSVPKECVRIIDNGEVTPFDTPTQGVEIGDILAGIFGTDPIPQNTEIAKKMNRLNSMITEGLGDSVEWNSLYNELTQYFGKEYPPLLGSMAHKNFIKKMNEVGRDA